MEDFGLQSFISSSCLFLAADPGSTNNKSSVENISIEGVLYNGKKLKQFF